MYPRLYAWNGLKMLEIEGKSFFIRPPQLFIVETKHITEVASTKTYPKKEVKT